MAIFKYTVYNYASAVCTYSILTLHHVLNLSPYLEYKALCYMSLNHSCVTK